MAVVFHLFLVPLLASVSPVASLLDSVSDGDRFRPERPSAVVYPLIRRDTQGYPSRYPSRYTPGNPLSESTTAEDQAAHAARSYSVKSDLDPAKVTTACNGTQGMWVRNGDPLHHPPLKYTLGEQAGNAQKHFKPTAKQPYREATLWDWHPADGCELTRLTRSTFCSAMSKAGLNRILFVGDSLTYMMSQSLWKLVGGKGDMSPQFQTLISNSTVAVERALMTDQDGALMTDQDGYEVRMHTVQNISCDNNKSILLGYHRSDLLEEAGQDGGQTRTGAYCEFHDGQWRCSWQSDYRKDLSTTLLLVNTGAHMHDSEAYRKVIDRFGKFISGLSGSQASKQPKVVFRASSPGHANCKSYTQPVRSAEDVKLTTQDIAKYTWDLVPEFNDYVKDVVGQMRSKGVDISFLDVYPMTVTRPDGHRWDVGVNGGDCLHYYLPGVPDWWNHLLLQHIPLLRHLNH